ncbi:hypothetical protein FRC15_011401 [Serendipita sp. 397]|nr:hypothetical protein FRC15_011401 [Serendipita sp. 397]
MMAQYQESPTSSEKRYHPEDVREFDNAMDEHAPELRNSLQNTEALVRGIVAGMMPPPSQSRKKGSARRSSASVTTNGSSKHPREPHRAASLSQNVSPTIDEISLLINRLASERQKTANLQASLAQAQADLAFQTKRLENADERLSELKRREEEGNTRRKKMEVELSKSREQLKIIKVQYEGAIEEIKKAQKDIDTLDEERQKAVEETIREREKVRKLQEERKLREAREEGYKEGRRLGMEEGVKMGKQEGRKYGIKDGKDAEKEKQKRAMVELVQSDEPLERQPEHIPFPEPQPAIRETYNVIGDETPGNASRQTGLMRGVEGTNLRNLQTYSAGMVAPVVTVDPQMQTANVIGLPVIPSAAPILTSQQPDNIHHRSNSQPNPDSNINILAGGLEYDDPRASYGHSQRGSVPPPRVDATSSNRPTERASTGGMIGYRAPIRTRSDSNGARNGRSIVTPPSVSTRSTPLEQLSLVDHSRGYSAGEPGTGRERSSSGVGLRDQMVAMTPITEAGSEPAPSPVQPYFPDAAMGVRPPSTVYTDPTQNGKHSYVPPHKRSSQPSPTTGPAAPGMWPRRSPQPPLSSSQQEEWHHKTSQPSTQQRPPSKQGHRKVPPSLDHQLGSDAERYGAPKSASRTGSRIGKASIQDEPMIAMPDIEVAAATPPHRATERSTKMAQAGGHLMGSPAFVTKDVTQPQGAQNGVGEYGPHGTPLVRAQSMRSPIGDHRELSSRDYRESDPSGGVYRPGMQSQSQHNGHHQRSMSTSVAEGFAPRSPARFEVQPPRSPSRREMDRPPSSPHLGQARPPGSPAQFHTDLAHPTPRHYVNPLEFSPEEINVLPSGTTPTPSQTTFNIPPMPEKKKKGKPSTETKKRRREGFVDYDDEVPQIANMGRVDETEPPQTTRSRVQSMYGISNTQRGSQRTPAYESAPLPGSSSSYESAPPPPLPKSARMVQNTLPQQVLAMGVTAAFNNRTNQPMPSPQKSTTSSQNRRAMEEDLDLPIKPYDPNDDVDNYDNHSVVDILEEKADAWDTRSGKFIPRRLSRSHPDHDLEVIPPANASPMKPNTRQDASFLGTLEHPPPPSPVVGVRGPPNAYVTPGDFDDSNVVIPNNLSFIVDHSGNPIRSPLRQSLPVTASARSSTNVLPPVKASDLPWNTGRTANSQLPRQSMYESAPTTATMPQTSTTWAYPRDSTQTVAGVGPIGNGTFGFATDFLNNSASLALANATPLHTGAVGLSPVMGSVQLMPAALPPPGSTRANIMDVAPNTARSMLQPLPPPQSQSQIMLAGMLSPETNQPEPDDDPVIPSQPGAAGAKKKKGKKGKK